MESRKQMAPTSVNSSFTFEEITQRDRVRNIEFLKCIAICVPKRLCQEAVKLANDSFNTPEIMHLKRVRRCNDEQFSDRVQVVLLPITSEHEYAEGKSKVMEVFHELLEAHATLEEVNVPKFPPKNFKELDEWKKIWPVSYTPPQIIQGIVDDEGAVISRVLSEHFYGTDGFPKKDKAIVFDPSKKKVVGVGFDLSDQGFTLDHSIMTAISDVSIKRKSSNDSELCQKRNLDESDEEEQYLCTGLELYCTLEPCIMCAMALLHSRIKRVLFIKRNPSRGGLGSKIFLHEDPRLNHRFRVFQASTSIEK